MGSPGAADDCAAACATGAAGVAVAVAADPARSDLLCWAVLPDPSFESVRCRTSLEVTNTQGPCL